MKQMIRAATCSAVLILAACEGTVEAEPKSRSAYLFPGLVEHTDIASVYSGIEIDDRDSLALGEGLNGLVTGTTSPQAQLAGVEMLRQGGTAMDAALTTAISQVVHAAGSWVSYSGLLTLVYYEASTGQVHALNSAYNVPLAESDPESVPEEDEGKDPDSGDYGRTVLVPGFMAGVESAHARFGSLPFSRLFEDAIFHARQGITIGPELAEMIRSREDVLGKFSNTKQIFTDETGEFLAEGDVLLQPALAKTLEAVAQQGATYMYKGAWAEKFVAAVQGIGGLISLQDLERYEPIWSDPSAGTYGEYMVHGLDEPSVGGVAMIEALQIMEAAELGARQRYDTDPETFARLAQIGTASMLREFMALTGSGDGFGYPFTSQARQDKQIAAALWARMEQGALSMNPDMMAMLREAESTRHSDAVIAVDASGNMVSLVHTINTGRWGTTGLFVDGVSINDSGSDNQKPMAVAGAGGRVPDPTAPLILLRNGVPAIGMSSIGAGLNLRTLCTLTNLIDHHMSPQDANDVPCLTYPRFPELTTTQALRAAVDPDAVNAPMTQRVIEGQFTERVVREARAMGLLLDELPFNEGFGFRGYTVSVTRSSGGEILGAAPRDLSGLSGVALGWNQSASESPGNHQTEAE